MTNTPLPQRVLAIALGTRGFGFTVMEGADILVDWGVKSVKEDKQSGCLAKVAGLVIDYAPDLIVFEDTSAESSRRGPRIRRLTTALMKMAAAHRIQTQLVSRKRVNKVFFPEGHGTKYELAELLAKRFSSELHLRMPLKRKAWTSEDHRMGIFDAVALGLVGI